MPPLLIVIAGPPVSGKSTLGRLLSSELNLHYCDSDELRAVAFGVPNREEYFARWKNLENARALILKDMTLMYRLLHEAVLLTLEEGRSMILSATYASKSSQEFLKGIIHTHTPRFRFILCDTDTCSEEEIKRRLSVREEENEYVLGSVLWEDYQAVMRRYERPDTTGVFSSKDILVLNTSMSLEKCVSTCIKFINK